MIIPFELNVSLYSSREKSDSSMDVPTVSAISASTFEASGIIAGRNLEVEEDFSSQTIQTVNRLEVAEVTEWTRKEEQKFNRLAQRLAFGDLSLEGKLQFEKLSMVRRRLKNPRKGEEVVAEYEQRKITRKMISTLQEYVEWHKKYASNSSWQTT